MKMGCADQNHNKLFAVSIRISEMCTYIHRYMFRYQSISDLDSDRFALNYTCAEFNYIMNLNKFKLDMAEKTYTL